MTPSRLSSILVATSLAIAVVGWLVDGGATPPPAPSMTWWLLGARYSIVAWLSAASVAFLVGSAFGMWAALGPRVIGLALSRSVEIAGAAPTVVVAGVVMARLSDRPGLAFVGAVAILRSIDVACVIREKAAEVAARDFIGAARASGAGTWRILRRHVAPHVGPTAAASALLTGPALFGLEASMVYLGVAEPFPASWTAPLATPGQSSTPALLLSILSIMVLTSAAYALARSIDDASAVRTPIDVGNGLARD